MAYVLLGTKVSVSSDKIPAGFEAPTVAPFADEDYSHKTTLTIPSSVATSNRADTFLAIIKDETDGIEKKIETKISNDFDVSTNDVNVWIDMRDLDGNKCPSGTNEFLTSADDEYSVLVVAHIKITTPA